MIGIRDFVIRMIPEEEVEYFAHWAFGYNFKNFDVLIQFANAWNNLHSDLFEINYEDLPYDDIRKMVEHWKKIMKGV